MARLQIVAWAFTVAQLGANQPVHWYVGTSCGSTN
jgi:hypothetical protein